MLKKLGPGLLYAGAAIGVSHLVQSTRAGALFGLSMIAIVVIVHAVKFPFFQYGPRYVAATGHSLLHGYQKLGKWALGLFFVLTLATMFIIQAAIFLVTAGVLGHLLGGSFSILFWVAVVVTLAIGILISGNLTTLNKIMKWIMLLLSITTIAAFIFSFAAPVVRPAVDIPFSWSNSSHLLFLIAFIGWMPAPIDISVWYSVWSEEELKTNGPINMKQSMFDFHVGYWGTALLAICFVGLGAMMLHNTGVKLSSNAVIFSGQIIQAYTATLGSWAGPIIGIAAFTTMLSTSISVLDGISRVMIKTNALLFTIPKKSSINHYRTWLLVLSSGALIIVYYFSKNMKSLVDFATSISFLTAPFLAYLNYKAITSKAVKVEFQPSRKMRAFSIIGLVLLSLFSVGYTLLTFI